MYDLKIEIRRTTKEGILEDLEIVRKRVESNAVMQGLDNVENEKNIYAYSFTKDDEIKNPKELNLRISESNAWRRMVEFFSTNEAIRPLFEEVNNELIKDQCFSMPIICITTIERLLEQIEILSEPKGEDL